MFYFVQEEVWGVAGAEGEIQRNKKRAEEWEDKVKKILETITNIEMKREQYEGESWMSSVNSMEADFDTEVCLYVHMQCVHNVVKWVWLLVTLNLLHIDPVYKCYFFKP